jgi:8-oxo-dGTP pyrophosphatase MutT (NUDIX family)
MCVLSYEDLLAVFKEADMDVGRFDKESRKDSKMLFKEIDSRDDVVVLYDRVKKRMMRCATTVAILLRVPHDRLKLLETMRIFPNGEIAEGVKEWSMTETFKIGETAAEAACRGLQEEFGLTATPDMFSYCWPNYCREVREYESRAYRGILTNPVLHSFVLDVAERPWEEGERWFKDTRTLIYVRWFAY